MTLKLNLYNNFSLFELTPFKASISSSSSDVISFADDIKSLYKKYFVIIYLVNTFKNKKKLNVHNIEFFLVFNS